MLKPKIKYALTLLTLLPCAVHGQTSTYLGFEMGPKFERHDYIDNGDGLYTESFYHSPIYGVSIGQDLNEALSVESGFYINNYGESYRIRGEGFGYSVSSALTAYQIPLRLKARMNLIKDKLSVATTVGYTVAINSNYGSTGSGSGFSSSTSPSNNDSTRTESVSSYSLKKSYGLIETGFALEYEMKNDMQFIISANYFAGLSRIIESNIKYRINDEPEQTGTIFSNGDYYSITLGIRYPLSKIWRKRVDE